MEIGGKNRLHGMCTNRSTTYGMYLLNVKLCNCHFVVWLHLVTRSVALQAAQIAVDRYRTEGTTIPILGPGLLASWV